MEPAGPGEPCNFEDWSVWRNFHEAGRLMTTYFHVFRPAVFCLLFPASLISVVFFQFLTDLYPPDAPFPGWALGETINTTFRCSTVYLLLAASNVVLGSLKATIYALDAAKFQNGESPQVLVDLLSPCRSKSSVGGRRHRAWGVLLLCFLAYLFCMPVPVAFGFGVMAAVGMPKWTAFLFTPLLVAGQTLVSLYLVLLVDLAVRLWMYAGADERPALVVKSTSSGVFVA